METGTKGLYAFMGIILPLLLLLVDIMYFGASAFPMVGIFLWISFSVFIVLPWTE
jgi:hypothetical protein